MPRQYRVISADGHIDLNPDVWTHRVAAKWRDRAPKRVKMPNGSDAIVVDGGKPNTIGITRSVGVAHKNAKLRSKIVPAPPEHATETSSEDSHVQGAPPRMSWAPAAQTGLRYRCGTLPKLRRRLEDHRLDRRSAGDRQDPQPSGPANPRPAACVARRVDLFQTI